jgi:hypothetical protein
MTTSPTSDGISDEAQPWCRPEWQRWTVCLLRSYRRWLHRDLVPEGSTPEETAKAVFLAPFVVVSHGIEADPRLCYLNQTALRLWEGRLDQLLGLPSRYTAEPVHRDERARLLEQTARQGYVDNYRGVRVSLTGRRFLIERAIVWNLVDEHDQRIGQAATFSEWTELPERADSRSDGNPLATP